MRLPIKYGSRFFVYWNITQKKCDVQSSDSPYFFEDFCVAGCDNQLPLLRPGRLGPLEVVSEVGKFA